MSGDTRPPGEPLPEIVEALNRHGVVPSGPLASALFQVAKRHHARGMVAGLDLARDHPDKISTLRASVMRSFTTGG